MGIVGIFILVLTLPVFLYVAMIFAVTSGYLSGVKAAAKGEQITGDIPSPAGQGPKPGTKTVTLIIPVRNESDHISFLLEDLSQQDYPSAYLEIIIADDFSEDQTMELARKWTKDHEPVNIILAESGPDLAMNYGKKKAIERALEKAGGELVITTDADTRHGPCWVSEMTAAFTSGEIQMVLGPVMFTGEESLFQKIQCLEFLGIMGVTAGSSFLGFPLMCNGANLAYRSQAFRDAGGFSGNQEYHSGDDQFLMMKFRKKFGRESIRFLQEKEAIARTVPSGSWQEFFQQRVRWVSKSRGYRDPFVLAAGLLTYGQFVLLMAGLIVGIFHPVLLLVTGILWLVKISAEFPLVWMTAGFFVKKTLMKYYFPAQVFQFFYVIFTGLAGQFNPYFWRGRSFRR
jgi:cellulose synthase/poly-beta-1,6-N-acetylglucosamine synthase-like glycosyltransferase